MSTLVKINPVLNQQQTNIVFENGTKYADNKFRSIHVINIDKSYNRSTW